MNNIKTGKFGEKISPSQSLIDAMGYADQMKCVVISWVDKDDHIHSGWSNAPLLSRMGMMQVTAIRMLEVEQDQLEVCDE